MNDKRPRTRPIVLLMYVLTFTTGIIDAVTILGLGDIFASLMTGNVVFIGLGLGGFEEVSPLRSAFAILAFILGSVAAGAIAALDPGYCGDRIGIGGNGHTKQHHSAPLHR